MLLALYIYIYISYTYSNYINIPTHTAWIFIQSICSIHSRILPLKPQGDQQKKYISFNKNNCYKVSKHFKLTWYVFNVWIYQLEHLDLCLVSQGLTFKFFLLWVRASTGVGFWDPKKTREPTTRKNQTFIPMCFGWVSMSVSKNVIWFYVFTFLDTLGDVSSQNEGCPKPRKLSFDLKVSGPPLFLRHAEHLFIFLFPKPTRKKTKESNCWNIHAIQNQEHKKNTQIQD